MRRFSVVVLVVWAGAAFADAGWKTYTFADSGFSASFPAKPNEGSQSQDNERFGRMESKVYLAEHGGAAFAVSVTSFAKKVTDKPDALLDGIRDDFVAGTKGKLLREAPATVRGFPGRALELEAPGQSIVARIYLVDTRLYLLVTVHPRENAGAPNAKRFLDGFTLLR
jgi:hypothetical protein